MALFKPEGHTEHIQENRFTIALADESGAITRIDGTEKEARTLRSVQYSNTHLEDELLVEVEEGKITLPPIQEVKKRTEEVLKKIDTEIKKPNADKEELSRQRKNIVEAFKKIPQESGQGQGQNKGIRR